MKNQRVKGANRIFCGRGKGQTISSQDCVHNVTPLVCSVCENPQLQNIPASADTVTEAEENSYKYDGIYRSSAAIGVEDGFIDK